MSFGSYGMIFLGVVLGGIVLLVSFSCLAMSQKEDEYQDQLEDELRQGHLFTPHQASSGNTDNFCSLPNPKSEQADGAETGIIISP